MIDLVLLLLNIMYVLYARYKWQSNGYWINLKKGVLTKHMQLNSNKPYNW